MWLLNSKFRVLISQELFIMLLNRMSMYLHEQQNCQ